MKINRILKLTFFVFTISLLTSCIPLSMGYESEVADIPNVECYTISRYGETIEILSYVVDGVEYKVFRQAEGGIHVINHSKEVLEFKKLKATELRK
jgi:hypothetical protein